jgi:DNA processing protein
MDIDAGLASWFRLTLTPGIGPAAVRRLLREFGLPERILAARRAELARYLAADALRALDSAEVGRAVEEALRWAEAPGHSALTLADERYPRLLLEIADPPPLLYCCGRLELLDRPAIAIVGSRNATAAGAQNAESFAKAFSGAGIAIVSGLALGIDTAAHRGGLAGAGSTIAVLGTGIDRCYPTRNADLAREIAAQGLLISEFPLGTRAIAANFPRRNQLISGLSRGCLVVEAALASGSLITARAALEQGREVFAIPGSIHSPLAKGCHALIKAGAKLVETADDVLAELPGLAKSEVPPPRPVVRATSEAPPLLAQMGFDPIDVDTLCRRLGLRAEEVSGTLLRLELEGLVCTLPGGLFQRIK